MEKDQKKYDDAVRQLELLNSFKVMLKRFENTCHKFKEVEDGYTQYLYNICTSTLNYLTGILKQVDVAGLLKVILDPKIDLAKKVGEYESQIEQFQQGSIPKSIKKGLLTDIENLEKKVNEEILKLEIIKAQNEPDGWFKNCLVM